jgi:acyl-coenzyme A synthetase/AMP-(fatty) acid ligase
MFFFFFFIEGYGQTESTLLCGTFKKMNKWVKPGSIGKAAPGYDVRIVNNMGKEVPRGEQAGGLGSAYSQFMGYHFGLSVRLWAEGHTKRISFIYAIYRLCRKSQNPVPRRIAVQH